MSSAFPNTWETGTGLTNCGASLPLEADTEGLELSPVLYFLVSRDDVSRLGLSFGDVNVFWGTFEDCTGSCDTCGFAPFLLFWGSVGNAKMQATNVQATRNWRQFIVN